MGRDNLKFLSALTVTLLLLGLVIYASYRRDLRARPGAGVDLKKIEVLIEKGVISNTEASWWEKTAPEPEP